MKNNPYILVEVTTKLQAVCLQESLEQAGIPSLIGYGDGTLHPDGDDLMVFTTQEYAADVRSLFDPDPERRPADIFYTTLA
jgi:hypothetical protein